MTTDNAPLLMLLNWMSPAFPPHLPPRRPRSLRGKHGAMRLVQTCRAKLPIAVHEVRYEAVIGDFDASVGALLSFLGLPWDDAVRGYAETAKRRVIATPSASQVVQPLYTSSRGKWLNYRRFLDPVLPVLEPWVAAFGYEAS